MAARGHIPSTFERRVVQAPGMMRHGSFPGLGPVGHRPLEPLHPYELLENKLSVQTAEMERLIRENQRFAAAHVTVRQELIAIEQEMQRLEAHTRGIQTESDIQIRGLLEKIVKMQADLQAGETLKKDLQQAHIEAQSLITARQELNSQIKQASQELQRAHTDIKKLPEMQSELDNMRQDHQKLRSTFEYEKGSNIELVEKMRAMETNLISMAREVEKLRSEVLNVEKRASAPNPYGGTYGSPNPSYPSIGQSSGYMDAYGRPHVQMSSGATAEGMNPYGGNNVGVIAAGSGAVNGGWGGSYDTSIGVESLTQR